MDPHVKLAQLRALIERAPDFNAYTVTSRDHQVWLGQAHAYLHRYDPASGREVKMSADQLHLSMFLDGAVAKIFNCIHRAISDLELEITPSSQATFSGGAVYDFFRALNEVIASAEKSIFIVDPYLDADVFDHYLTARQSSVHVRLLTNKGADQLSVGAAKYCQQHGSVLEIRKSNSIHDRVIFIDQFVCIVIGQSLKDAAKAKPTYLAPLSPDVVPAKFDDYDSIWQSASILV